MLLSQAVNNVQATFQPRAKIHRIAKMQQLIDGIVR
jgi:hypothetical protein